ncbi:unnamed protein product [Arctia plantaginis]|uniref:phosphatidylinositol-3,5-bisphosphate 3-phosphatase n=1 Tax=Arctia plantaginis TaxID=874455 RepID=A0A8S1BF19_ARCPL|nr:unnamed protein product [Arctia plantaginis]
MLINTFLDTEDFVHLYYPEDEPAAAQGCGAGARMASKYPPRPPSPEYSQVIIPSASDMTERYHVPPQPEPPPVMRAADLYPRLRTQYDEPGLDAGFTPICGEFVQWVGRTADGTIAMSNYRLHVQPRRRDGLGVSIPLRLIDALEPRDLVHLIVLCKNGRQLKCTFTTGDHCLEWCRRLNTALAPLGSIQETFAAAYAAWAKEQPPTSVHRALIRASQSAQRHWFGPEVERLGFTSKGAWRVTAANADYKLCPSYPPLLVVPASICDEDLNSVARFRAMRRIPAVVWRHRGNGAVIARSSQPEVGWLGWRNTDDERLLAAFVSACNADRGMQPPTNNKQLKLVIVDARSYTSAVTNRARGGGCECQAYYPAADIQFMCLPNIHCVRKSFQQMRTLAAETFDSANWHTKLDSTLWLQYLSGIARAASVVARAVAAGRPALVHCSDGWDRTPQIVAGAQLMLDPYYRTIEGFRVLIEREWLDFGHKFADRCGHQFGPEDPNERSPIFIQWLDMVHQMMLQFPCSFEFNEAYLIKLGTHVHSCMFGTFVCNTTRERREWRAHDLAPHVWHLLRAPAYTNHLYSPDPLDQTIWPECSARSLCVWGAMFGSYKDARHEDRERDARPAVPALLPAHNGIMTKTRSCDNLLNDGEKRTAQRRCSDPSLAPDVMKLSMVVSNECENRNECRAALTDSCVDDLPILPVSENDSSREQDQVDGLHPDHFENSTHLPRDIASGSSSLERELGAAAAVTDKVIDHSDDVIDVVSTPDPTINGTVVDVTSPDVDTPEEPPVFVSDTYTDILGMQDAARESGRTRNISITWRSISESSNQSSTGFELHEGRGEPAVSRNTSHETSPLDSHNLTEGDRANHNVLLDISLSLNGVTNGGGHVVDDVSTKFLEVDLNGGATSSSMSSESEGEAQAAPRRTRVASQLTLCPTSPRRVDCCRCSRRASNTTRSCAGAEAAAAAASGGGAGAVRPDPLDGLPPALDPLQARLQQIILNHKKVVEELTGQLRHAREALRQTSPGGGGGGGGGGGAGGGAEPRALAAPPAPHAATHTQKSAGAFVTGRSGSSSGSASEVEVGEEARGVVWLPDSAAPRCQHCKNHFWLARRRHHCRRCGGIFCGSCSEMSAWGSCGAVRMCRRCRALR